MVYSVQTGQTKSDATGNVQYAVKKMQGTIYLYSLWVWKVLSISYSKQLWYDVIIIIMMMINDQSYVMVLTRVSHNTREYCYPKKITIIEQFQTNIYRWNYKLV